MHCEVLNIKRFWDKVEKTDSCWNWTAHKGKKGYGRFQLNGRSKLAHRVSYEWAKGKIPDGLQIDHLCRNKACVNPEHLEVVTLQENIKRRGAAITHCPQGHEYTKNNTWISKQGHRYCKACHSIKMKEWYKRTKNVRETEVYK